MRSFSPRLLRGKPQTRAFLVARFGLRGAIRMAAEHLHFDRLQHDGDAWPFTTPQDVAEIVYMNLGLGPIDWRDHVSGARAQAEHAHRLAPVMPDPGMLVLHPSAVALSLVLYLIARDLPDEQIVGKIERLTYDEVWAARLYLAEKQAARLDAALPSTPKRLVAFHDGLLPYPTTRAAHVLGEIARVQQGVSPALLEPLSERLGMGVEDLCSHLSIPTETLCMVEKEGSFPAATSERIVRVERLLDQAARLMGSDETARAWLKAPLAAFDGQTPLELARTDVGALEMSYLLSRQAYRVDVAAPGWAQSRPGML